MILYIFIGLTSLSVIISGSVNVTTNGIISRMTIYDKKVMLDKLPWKISRGKYYLPPLGCRKINKVLQIWKHLNWYLNNW